MGAIFSASPLIMWSFKPLEGINLRECCYFCLFWCSGFSALSSSFHPSVKDILGPPVLLTVIPCASRESPRGTFSEPPPPTGCLIRVQTYVGARGDNRHSSEGGAVIWSHQSIRSAFWKGHRYWLPCFSGLRTKKISKNGWLWQRCFSARCVRYY